MLAVRDHPRGTFVGSSNRSRRRSGRIGINIRSAIRLRLRNEAWPWNWSDLRHGRARHGKPRLNQHWNRLSGSHHWSWNQSRRSNDGSRGSCCNWSRDRNGLRNGRSNRLSWCDILLELNGRGRRGSRLRRRDLHGNTLRHRNRLQTGLNGRKGLREHLSGHNLSRRDRINAQHGGWSQGRWRLIPCQCGRMNPGPGRVRSQADHRNRAGGTRPFRSRFGRACGRGRSRGDRQRRNGDRSVSGNGNKAVSRHRRCPVSLPVALTAHHRTAVRATARSTRRTTTGAAGAGGMQDHSAR